MFIKFRNSSRDPNVINLMERYHLEFVSKTEDGIILSSGQSSGSQGQRNAACKICKKETGWPGRKQSGQCHCTVGIIIYSLSLSLFLSWGWAAVDETVRRALSAKGLPPAGLIFLAPFPSLSFSLHAEIGKYLYLQVPREPCVRYDLRPLSSPSRLSFSVCETKK